MRNSREAENRYDNGTKKFDTLEEKIPYENLAKWSLKRVQESENQKVRGDNK